jgi:hypothetical protein
MRDRFSKGQWDQMCELHALPPNWESMDYQDFLRERRSLMAQIIKRGFEACS